MTQQEFEQRVGMAVDAAEFEAINTVYMASDVDKDEFCMYWKKMNLTRIQLAKRDAKAVQERQKKKSAVYDIQARLQSRPYNFNDYAVDVLPKRDTKTLESVGINPVKNIVSVLFDIQKFLHAE